MMMRRVVNTYCVVNQRANGKITRQIKMPSNTRRIGSCSQDSENEPMLH
jgi:hypothetical protein